MNRWMKPALLVSLGLGAGLLVGVGMLIGVLAAFGLMGNQDQTAGAYEFPFTALDASATHAGETFAIATGFIDDEVEGLFTLDFLTGELQCFVLSPRTGNPIGNFKGNVMGDVGAERGKAMQYIMVTGRIAARGGRGGALRPASCVVYVANAKTGLFAAYSLDWNRSAVAANQPQGGPFRTLTRGKARNLAVR